MSDLFLSYSTTSAGVPKYTSFASLPAPAGSSRGDMAVTTDTDTLYEFNGTAWVVVGVAGSTVVAVTDTATIDLTNTSGNLSAAIVNSSITDALVSPTAAIGLSKLATGALPSGITVDSSNIVDGSIVNSDVSPTAAIDASKIADGSVSNAEFQRLDGVTSGIQGQIDGKVAKTGDSVSGDLTFASGFGIESTSAASSLDIGTTSNTATLNLGTGAHTNTINIGTGAGTTTINIGGSGDTVAIAGTLATVNTTNLDVTDKLITVNKGGLASSGFISGISIEEGGSEVGYIRTNATRDGVELKAPAATGNFDFRPGSADTFIISNAATSAKTITIPNVTGTLITTGDTGTVTSTMIANDTIVNDDISPTAAIALSKLATGALPTGITVDTANIIADSVTLDKLGAGALPTDITVASANIVDETITNNDISLTANIARSKLASGTANHVVINDGSGVMTSEATLSPTRGGTGQTSVTTGDILYSSASNVISKLPIGTSGQLLTVSGGVPTWQTGLSDPMTTAGDMIIRDGSNITARLPVGAANTVLTSNGTVPTYAQVTSAMIADGTIVNADISGSTAIDGSKIQSASASNAGVITTGSQTFAGIKEFTGTIQLSGVPTTPGAGAVSLTGSTNILKITGESAFALNLSTGALSADRTLTAPNRSGTIITTSDNGTVTSTMIADGTIVNADISGSAAIDGSKIVAASASVPGVVTTSTQTIAGNKTLSGVTVVSNTGTNTAGNTTATAIQTAGGIFASASIWTAGNYGVGHERTSDGASSVNFQSVSGSAAISASITRASGANGNFNILQTGTGVIDIRNNAGTSTGQGVAVQGYRAGSLNAGYVGETYKTYRTSGSAVSLTTGVYGDVLSYQLPSAGVWLISGQCYLENTSGVTQPMTAILVQTSAPAENESESISIIDVPSGNTRIVALPSRVIATTGTPTFTIRARPSSANTTIGTFGNSYQWISVTRIA